MKVYALIAVLGISLVGCTDAQMGKFSALGGSAKVDCYSGERLIYSGESTGKVSNSESSDGYYFIDKSDNKLKEVSGNCIITYNNY
jgi:hypothetical protein